jgi:hypothetical protein
MADRQMTWNEFRSAYRDEETKRGVVPSSRDYTVAYRRYVASGDVEARSRRSPTRRSPNRSSPPRRSPTRTSGTPNMTKEEAEQEQRLRTEHLLALPRMSVTEQLADRERWLAYLRERYPPLPERTGFARADVDEPAIRCDMTMDDSVLSV